MKFSSVKENILQYIQYATSFTSPKNLTTILENIYISAEENKLTIKATNYQIGFCCSIDINVYEKGSITVNGKKLFDAVKALPDGSLINFHFNGKEFIINTGKSSLKLSTISPEEFPTIDEIKAEFYLKMDAKEFTTLLKRTSFCISGDSSSPEHSGEHFNVSGNRLEMFATSPHRIAIASTALDANFSNDFIINIPKKTIEELKRILENCKEVEIATDREQISFKAENMTIYSKLISKYIKGSVNKLFNREYPVKVKLNRKQFIEAARISTVLTDNDMPGLILSFENNKLNLSSIQTEHGEGSDVMDGINFSGDKFDITLNGKHVLEILSYIETDEFTFEMADSLSPVLITPESNDYRYLVAAMNIDRR